MVVVKKSGRLEKFDKHKLSTSINNSATDIGIRLNESDLNVIIKDVIKKLASIRGEDGEYSSYEIMGVIIDVLKNDRFIRVLESYLRYKIK